MNPLTKDTAGTLLRLVLAVAAGVGLFDADKVEQYASALTIVGVGVWGVWQKVRAHRELKNAGAR